MPSLLLPHGYSANLGTVAAMILQYEQLSKPGSVHSRTHTSPRTPETLNPGGPLEVVVMFTDVPGTLKALKTAAELAHNLSGRIRLLAPQVVPYPLPLESAPVSQKFNERRFQTLASHGCIDTRVEMCLCRDRDAAVCQALQPEALVVMGARPSWWPTAEKALARKLRRKGHHVILVDSERTK
jgi:hypothetical protein